MAEFERNVVIWGDGRGSTALETMKTIKQGLADFNIVGLITAIPDEGFLNQAKYARDELGMDVKTLEVQGGKGIKQNPESETKVLRFMHDRKALLLVTMGCLTFIGSNVIRELNGEVESNGFPKGLEEAKKIMVPSDDGFGNYLPVDFPKLLSPFEAGKYSVINTHPAPTVVTANTYGIHAQERLFDLESRVGGQTVHVVGEQIDQGGVLAFHSFPIHVRNRDNSAESRKLHSDLYFDQAQRIEKAHIALDVQEQTHRIVNHLIAHR